ncbi:MAG: SDR family oxidoreductase [Gammaproteobacteria bacterium]
MATVLITGTNRGIGLEFVRQYLARGDQVIATCRDPDGAAELLELQQEHTGLTVLALDVSQSQSIETFAQGLDGQAIDIFINNAGVYGPRDPKIGNFDGDTWAQVMQINAIAPFLLTQAVMVNLRKGTAKKIIYITSKMGSVGDNSGGGSYLYRASKAALNAAAKSVAIDLAGEGFRAAVLHPGWVLTDMGGPNALIDSTTSVNGMMNVIDNLSAAQSGGFFAYDGAEIPW